MLAWERGTPFGGPVAHGYLTISLAPALLPQLLVVENSSKTVNYGIDKMRLPSPVPAGARVRLQGEDLEIDLSDKALSQMMLDLLLPRYRAILVEAGQ